MIVFFVSIVNVGKIDIKGYPLISFCVSPIDTFRILLLSIRICLSVKSCLIFSKLPK